MTTVLFILRAVLLWVLAPVAGALLDTGRGYILSRAGDRRGGFLIPPMETVRQMLKKSPEKHVEIESYQRIAVFYPVIGATAAGLAAFGGGVTAVCIALAFSMLPLAFACIVFPSPFSRISGYRLLFGFTAVFVYFLLLSAAGIWLGSGKSPVSGPMIYHMHFFLLLMPCFKLMMEGSKPFGLTDGLGDEFPPRMHHLLRLGRWYQNAGLLAVCLMLSGGTPVLGASIFLILYAVSVLLEGTVARIGLKWMLRWGIPAGFVMLGINLLSIYLFKSR
ncbi:MAG TPA: hypothetical protein DD727_10070 [Clostridiales bacterium]|nr:hypothetical protein [Clostridiales bacterium]